LLDVRRSLETLDEGDLLRRIARGDRRAFDELYRRTSPWLAVRLRRRCADQDVVAEVLQETYLAVWRSAGSHASAAAGGSALGWMWTIAAHRLIDAFRRRARQERVPAVQTFESVAPAAEDEALAGGIDTHLETALLALPPELRQVLRAMVLDGLTTRETSLLLGVPEGTVKTRARRARIAMREALS
jgi:RNA polymerase sigma-70 factor (ECF subfamily)